LGSSRPQTILPGGAESSRTHRKPRCPPMENSRVLGGGSTGAPGRLESARRKETCLVTAEAGCIDGAAPPKKRQKLSKRDHTGGIEPRGRKTGNPKKNAVLPLTTPVGGRMFMNPPQEGGRRVPQKVRSGSSDLVSFGSKRLRSRLFDILVG
jgi:hypothetical protein